MLCRRRDLYVLLSVACPVLVHCSLLCGQACFPDSKFVGMCPGSDHAKSMLRVWNYLASELPGSYFWTQGLCKQHATGLCLAPATVFMEFVTSLFCTCKLMHVGSFYKTYLEGLYLACRASTVRFDPVRDDVQPDPEDRKKNETLLEICFYGRDLHALNVDVGQAQEHTALESAKLKAGKRLLDACPGDWSSNHIYHWSNGVCCQTDAEAARCVFESVIQVVGHAVPTPALNKWTQLYPVVAQCCVGFCCHNLMGRAIEYAHTLSIPENAEDIQEAPGEEAPDEGAAVGLPRDERKAIAREKAARSKKSLTWAKDPATLPTLLSWICLSVNVMRLHYFLFRDASKVQYEAPSSSVPSARVHPVFDFTNTNTSRATQVLAQLTALLVPGLSGHSSGWKLLYDRYEAKWPPGIPSMCRRGLLLIYGNVYRRLVWFYSRPPWRLAKIFNEEVPLEEGQGDSRKRVTIARVSH